MLPFASLAQRLLLIIIVLAVFASPVSAQTFDVDFAQWAGPPLVKTKFGVYQTPLTTLPRLLRSMPLLREINVSDFRYEIGWGKPESLAHSQISGAAAQTNSTATPRLQYDFSAIDALATHLRAAGVRPLFAMTYCPDPLKSRRVWESWKDMPASLPAWQRVNQDYAGHLKRVAKLRGPLYEIWNEPDMPEPNNKMFFTGGPEDYERLYQYAADGIRAGDADALVGGPAAAYDLRYLTPLLSHPLDFASIHAYDNYATQLNGMRSALRDKPNVPILLTEYASFKELPPNGPQSRYSGAMRFFRDVKGLLAFTDVPKVYWAQWLDAGDGPGMGLLTGNGHRKALFNAFKIYGRMPVDQNAVRPDGSDGVGLMASSDQRSAGVVLWNETASERSVTVNLKRLPFGHGTMRLYRIDKEHASYVDTPAAEDLHVVQILPIEAVSANSATSWTGTVPAEGVVYLELLSSEERPRAAARSLGTYVRSYYWFPRRDADAYADFDPQTWVGRVGLGNRDDLAVAQIGNVIDNPVPRFQVFVEQSGPLRKQDRNSVFGVRLDFQSRNGGYSRSVLYHNGLYDAQRDAPLPWGKKGATPDETILTSEMNLGRPFAIDLARIAPSDWNRKRIILTFLMQNAGLGSRAKFTLTRP